MDSIARGNSNFSMLYQVMKAKLVNVKKYEAILLGDDAALRFALAYHDELFPKMPMIFFGINDYDLAVKASQTPYFTGLYENDYLEETMMLAMKLFPERKTFVALHDQTESGLEDINIFWSFRDKFPQYAFVDLNTSLLTKNELIFLLESLPKDALLFYMNCYSDKTGNIYSIRSRTSLVVRSAHVPIFRNYVGGEGMGILGGVVMDVEEQCNMAGNMLVRLFSGEDLENIDFIEKTPSRTIFDYSLLNEYKLDLKLLPVDTLFYNRPISFMEQYGDILPVVIMLVTTLLMLVLSSRIGSHVAKKLVKDLSVSRDKLLASEEQLRYQAEYDEVLDIYNRRTVTNWLVNTMTEKDIYSVLIIDIDDFKMLNENYGHSLADSILQYLVALIKGMAEDGDWKVARFGGDEFLIVIPNEQLTMECQTVKKLFAALREPIPLGDETLAITASIGASCSDGITSPDQHIVNAEGAMYEAKNRGKNGIVIYDDEMKKKAIDEIRIKDKLLHAFENDGFQMVYQPQIDSQTKLVSGYEALVRMKEPGIYPGQFIPVAERSGWIWKIGRITTELVIKQLAAWRDAGKELHPVSVNFSGNQLNDHGYIDFVEDLLKKYDIPPHFLEIEITEGLFLEKSALADEIFKRFKALGIRLLMDDFGTGYSSLGYLTYIPVDVIKLDKSLVDTYLVDGKDSFIKNIIHLMHDLNKDMIIEGVEEEWQFKRLREFGADTIQGYYFSKPIPPGEAIDFKVK
ncbi:bifunctional diguanylate cyclase/phosphodiesterase [uncultured Treponema sp.]|uniref:bifunctional diguanylate cyclase/phosphodiesterase n=1 Tax=uncultured Treponema sp. TaxID=162155 RepID=UPI0025FA2BB9|nr:bifunctional diguanylate cyclase/phosphodiesterase [uncultured Treponema sp.]